LSSEKVYVGAQEHDPNHESPNTEQAHAQSSYREQNGGSHSYSTSATKAKFERSTKMGSRRGDNKSISTNTLAKHTPILSHSMLIQRQRSVKTSNDGKYHPWSPILQRQFVDSNPGLSFGTLHGS